MTAVHRSLWTRARGALGRLRTFGHEHGVSTVEFALISPLFLLIMVGIIEMGRMMIEYSSIANAAREAARVGIIPSASATQIVSTARNMTISVGATPVVTVVARLPSGTAIPVATRTAGDTISVSVSHTFQPVGFIGAGSGIPLSSTASMRVE
jgi:Flp pilus assembly protein TadG